MTLFDIQQLVARKQYRYSRKVRDFIEDGYYDQTDIAHCILSASQIHKKERDEFQQAVNGMKWTRYARSSILHRWKSDTSRKSESLFHYHRSSGGIIYLKGHDDADEHSF